MSLARRRASPLLLLLPALACASVATQPADRLLRLGDAKGAAAAYEELLTASPSAPRSDELLYRAALAYALADLGDGGTARSLELLRQLAANHPQSEHLPSARLFIRLLGERLEHENAMHQARLRALDLSATNEALRRLADDLRSRLGTVEGDLDGLRDAMTALQRAAESAQAEAQARERDLRQLREEIDRLKAIDLELEPPRQVD